MTAGSPSGPFVIDTNVVAAGVLTSNPQSPTARLLREMLNGQLPFLLSLDLLGEYREVLLRPKLVRRHGMGKDEVDELLRAIAFFGRLRQPRAVIDEPPDPEDRHLWELVTSERGAILVTGDRALLDFTPAGVSVLTPGDAVRLVGA